MVYDKSKIVEMLKEDILEVVFTKANGDERTMRCSLKEDVLKPFVTETKSNRAENPDIVAVIDTDKNAWRSFRIDSIKSIKRILNG